MRWLRSFLNSEVLLGEARALIVIEVLLSASKFSMPFLTLFLVQARGLDYALAGFLVAVRGLGGLLAVMVVGALADRYGEKPVIATLLVGTSLSAAAIPSLQGVPALLLGFFLMGAFISAAQPPLSSMLVRQAPRSRWTELYSAEYWALNVGFAFTALAGGAVAAIALDWLFYLEAAGALVALVLVQGSLPAPSPRKSGLAWPRRGVGVMALGKRALGAASLALRDPLAVALISSTMLFAVCLSQMTGTLPLDMEAGGFRPDVYGYVIFWNGAMLIILQMRAGRVMAGRRGMRLLARAAGVSALGYGLLSWSNQSLALILACVSVWTLGEMMDAPVRNAVVLALARPGARARYLSLVSAAITLGYSIGPWFGGWLLQVAGRQTLWLGTAGLALVAGLVRYLITPEVERRLNPPATTSGRSQ